MLLLKLSFFIQSLGGWDNRRRLDVGTPCTTSSGRHASLSPAAPDVGLVAPSWITIDITPSPSGSLGIKAPLFDRLLRLPHRGPSRTKLPSPEGGQVWVLGVLVVPAGRTGSSFVAQLWCGDEIRMSDRCNQASIFLTSSLNVLCRRMFQSP